MKSLTKKKLQTVPAAESRYAPSLAAIGREFGVSHTTVRKDWRNQGMPIEDDGRYDLVKIAGWVALRRGNQDPNGKGGQFVDPERRELDMTLRQLNIEESTIRTAERRNDFTIKYEDYVSRESVYQFFAKFWTRLSQQADAIAPAMLAAYPKDCRTDLDKTLKAEVKNMMRTLARQEKKIADIETKKRKK